MAWYVVMFNSKKHRRSSTVQEEGLTNEGRHHLLLLHKQALNITRARLTACEVSVFSREISQLSKICPPPFLRSHIVHCPWVYSRDHSRSGVAALLL